MSKVLTRGRSGKCPEPHTTVCKYKSFENAVASGLSMTPADIERLAKQGIAVSTPAADQFRYDSDGNSWTMPPELMRDADRNSMWEMSHVAKSNIINARKRDKQMYT